MASTTMAVKGQRVAKVRSSGTEEGDRNSPGGGFQRQTAWTAHAKKGPT